MYLKKTVVLVALAFAVAAPTAGAMRAPIEGGDASQLVLAGHPKKANPNPKQPTLCVRYVNTPTSCLAFGF